MASAVSGKNVVCWPDPKDGQISGARLRQINNLIKGYQTENSGLKKELSNLQTRLKDGLTLERENQRLRSLVENLIKKNEEQCQKISNLKRDLSFANQCHAMINRRLENTIRNAEQSTKQLVARNAELERKNNELCNSREAVGNNSQSIKSQAFKPKHRRGYAATRFPSLNQHRRSFTVAHLDTKKISRNFN